MIYVIGGYRYRWDGDRLCLVLEKAGTKNSPGQLGLFDMPSDHQWHEEQHPRDQAGKFSRTNESAAKTDAQKNALKPVDAATGIAKSFTQSLKSSLYNKLSRTEAEYEGLDYDHPGAHWEADSDYDRMLDAYREGGDRALGQALTNIDFTDESNWKLGNVLAMSAFSSADWDYLSGYANKLLNGEKLSTKGANAATQAIAEWIESEVDFGLDNENSDQYRRNFLEHFASADSLQQWARKSKIWDLGRDETGTANELTNAALETLDLDQVGNQIAEQMQFPKAIAREQKTGRKGAAIVAWNQSESGKDSAAWDKFQRVVDWDAVGSYAKQKLQQPDASIPGFVKDQPTIAAMQAIALVLKQDESLVAKLARYDPGHVAKLNIENRIKDLPVIRSLMESEAGQEIHSSIDKTPHFQRRIKQKIDYQLANEPYPNMIAKELGINVKLPDWKQQTSDRLSRNFGVSHEQLRRLGLG